MAFAARFLSRSTRQVHNGQCILRSECAISARYFAKADGNAPQALKGDVMLKGIFLEVKKKFETAMGILRKEKITIDPNDPAAVAEYAKVMKTVREKADLFSESQRIKYTIETLTQDIPDARSYLLALKDIRALRMSNRAIGHHLRRGLVLPSNYGVVLKPPLDSSIFFLKKQFEA